MHFIEGRGIAKKLSMVSIPVVYKRHVFVQNVKYSNTYFSTLTLTVMQ